MSFIEKNLTYKEFSEWLIKNKKPLNHFSFSNSWRGYEYLIRILEWKNPSECKYTVKINERFIEDFHIQYFFMEIPMCEFHDKIRIRNMGSGFSMVELEEFKTSNIAYYIYHICYKNKLDKLDKLNKLKEVCNKITNLGYFYYIKINPKYKEFNTYIFKTLADRRKYISNEIEM